jgi:tRNA (guanine10-N2)-dimethyltransferase
MSRRTGDHPYWVELSGESEVLAERELAACVSVLEPGAGPPTRVYAGKGFREVRLSSDATARELARRLAFAHRVVHPLAEGPLDLLLDAIRMHAAPGGTGRVRVAAGAPGDLPRELPRALGQAFVHAGGSIDLENPTRDFLVIVPGTALADPVGATEGALTEVVGEVPRSEVEAHRSKNRSFRKPVTLPPRLARCMVNLARAPREGRVLDPFCGTGAILLEAGHLGYRTVGADLDGDMVRGSLRNLTEAGITPERILVSGVADLPEHLADLVPLDAIVCDPPYGRAATTGGKGAEEVLRDALRATEQLLRPGARAVLLLSTPELGCPLPPSLEVVDQVVGQRVHRSLTRYVVVLRRSADHLPTSSGN